MMKYFQEYLQDQFSNNYEGLDDSFEESFEKWMLEQNPEDWIFYGNSYAHKKQMEVYAEMGIVLDNLKETVKKGQYGKNHD